MPLQMSVPELLSLIASIVSVALGVFAIWLSLHFYNLSTAASVRSETAAEKIGATTDRLETLFNRLYADTFSTLRETIVDYRKHAWPEPLARKSEDGSNKEIEEKVNGRIEALMSERSREMSRVLQRLDTSESEIGRISADLNRILKSAVAESAKVESKVRVDAVQSEIHAAFAACHYSTLPVMVVLDFAAARGFLRGEVYKALARMVESGEIAVDNKGFGLEETVTWVGAPPPAKKAE